MVVRRGARLIGVAASAAALVGGFLAAGSPSANAEDPIPVVVQQKFTTADGVALQTTLTSPGPVEARPTVVEFSPYGNNSQTFSFGPDYHYLLVQIRGTGSSRGSFDALGPRTQRDVVEYPDVIESKSLVDSTGTVVQPYGDYTTQKPAKSLQFRDYKVELWPVGNRFEAGRRIRLSVVGTSAFSMPALPALHTIRVGGPTGARLLVPVLPGSDLPSALGG